LTIPNTYKKLLLELVASAESPTGIYAGDRHKFQSGFIGNLVDMLAGMRLLNHKQEFIRKRKFSQESGKAPTSYNMLQESFNTSAGLRNSGETSYVVKFIKACLSSCLRKHNKNFPGGWIYSSRASNNVKSDFALLNILGWTEKVPSQHKLLETIFNTVDPIDNKPKEFKIINLTVDKRNFTHQEFRTAVALSLPRIDTSFPDKHEEDLKLDPLSVRSLTIVNNFIKDKRDLLVDQLNECYALKVSLKNPKSKTKEIHYKISRDRMLGLTANMPLRDGKGTEFESFSKLPEKTQKFFREKYRFPSKRKENNEVPQSNTGEDTEIPDAIIEAGESAQKKRKMTKGQAKDTIRKSGRLAKLAAAKSKSS